MARNDRRREPRFDDSDDDGELRAERRPPPRARAKKKAKARRASSGSLFGSLIYWAFTLGLWGAIGGGALAVYYGSQLPPIDQLAIPKRPPNIAILSAEGELLANRGDTGGAAIRISDLPPYLPKAFIAIEDRRFYSHWGVDPQGIGRALLRNVTGRGGMQGGSTLTQQLAKNLFLTQERTISRKIQEAILALWLEHKFSKDQILELYLNRVYFGSGAYGVEAASERYFGHSARTATLSEAAVLAGLMKAPSKLAPDRNPQGATERAAQVVAAMAQEGHISEAMAKTALAHPARARHDTGAGSINYAADYVMDMLDDTIGAIDQDIVVTTTIDERLQTVAEGALKEELDRKGAKFGVTQGAIVSLDPNGAIRALVGGRDYSESQFNRAVSAKRQPGSAFKPFVYLAGLEHGLTPDTVREDGPLNVKGWQPENYSHEYFGPVTLTRALSLSLNTVAVRVGLEVGAKTVVKTAHRLGIQSELQPNASIALGTSEVTPLELVAAYAPFANGGIGVQPYIITKVKTAAGKTLYQRKAASFGRVIEPQYVAMMNTMMQETLLTGTARKAELPGWQAAGKTGTSQDFRDAWFVGYTSRLVTGVWLGNDDNSPTKKASGGNLPVEIWSRYMTIAHKGVPVAGLASGAWRPETAAAVDEVVAKPLDDLIGIFTGAARQPEPPRESRAARPAPAAERLRDEKPTAQTAPETDETATIPAPPPPRPRAARPQAIDDLLPPEDIPGAAPAPARPHRGERAPSPPSVEEDERNFVEKLFGGG
ncbi:PBP1A family penicillin-binding protein [Methylocystis sp. WRRC1]|uniref:transglycosylase domain-containing protein n=1 Tax=Methylocystis sp. WRRC1 TaxID=1732014 RepID=UPI001D14F4EE|nr:PBP1A family penicillin-binding protein [Methylocystis sp. WRRC1]MCC3245897.1 PBP1A family penicillin-binding protein [Methylocystis sp. WRRC1]